MPWLTDQRHSTSASVTGGRLSLDPALQSHILKQVQRELDAEVAWQNHMRLPVLNSSSAREGEMKEVKDFAGGIKDAVAELKQLMKDARGEFDVEVGRGKINATKVKALAVELKEANKEVESFLGETGSNFPPSETSNTPQVTGSTAAKAGFEPMHADRNGVTLNEG